MVRRVILRLLIQLFSMAAVLASGSVMLAASTRQGIFVDQALGPLTAVGLLFILVIFTVIMVICVNET